LIVVDASAILDFLLQRFGFEPLQRRLLADSSWHAPHVIDLEVAQAVRRWARAGRISAVRGQRILELHADLPITRWPHQPFLGRIWRLRANLTAYDAAYVSLAETLDAPLVTRDSRIAAASGHRARVERFE
jgi:predicted nucleic acid-binding protein